MSDIDDLLSSGMTCGNCPSPRTYALPSARNLAPHPAQPPRKSLCLVARQWGARRQDVTSDWAGTSCRHTRWYSSRRQRALALDDVADIDVFEAVVFEPHDRLIEKQLNFGRAIAKA